MTKARVFIGAFLLLVSGVACSHEDDASVGPAVDRPAPSHETVERIVDGDTIALASGTVVRLVQIDAPEARGSECYAEEATAVLSELLPPGTPVRIEPDPALDQEDRYGRRLAYVLKDGENVNETLVERGAASVWFYDGDRGRYADELLAAAQDAHASGRGLWGACEATLDPFRAVSTTHAGGPAAPASEAPPTLVSGDGDGECHPSYDPCLPIEDDLNCPAVEDLGSAPVRVSGSDPYRLDADGDGTGCE